MHQMTTLLMWISRRPAQALMSTQQQRKGKAIRSMISKAVLLKRQAITLRTSEEKLRRRIMMQKSWRSMMSKVQRIYHNVYREQACPSQ